MIHLGNFLRDTVILFIVFNLYGLIFQAITTGEFVFTQKIVWMRFLLALLCAFIITQMPTNPPKLITE